MGTKKEFQEIVFDEIAQKAGMKTFTPIKPKNGRISPIDSEANGHIYGAGSGGYWSTSEDLIKFGQWLNEKAKGEFRHLIEEHGEEFHENGVIKHAGDGRSFLNLFFNASRFWNFDCNFVRSR